MEPAVGTGAGLVFLERLRAYAGAQAFVHGDEPLSYRTLGSMVDEWVAYLESESIGPGDVVMLEGVCSPEVAAALLALVIRRAIVVPITPSPVEGVGTYLDVAEVEVVISVDRHGDRVSRRTGRVATNGLHESLRATGRPGLVLFSSGTSGRTKATVLDFARLLIRYHTVTGRGRRTIFFLNLDHIGGINTLLHTLSSGGTVITVPDRSPDTVLASIVRHGAEILPTTPTFLNMLLAVGAHRRFRTDTLELVTYGTEPMPDRTLELLRTALPGVRLKQTYGLSELGILPTKSKADGSGWMKLGTAGFAHKIVDGVLWIRSDTAMLGYLNAGAEFDEEGYFNTHDVVETDGEYLRVLGRRSEIINVGGEKVYPAEVENVILGIPNIADVTVKGRPSPVTGMVVTAIVHLQHDEDDRSVRRRVREYCRGRLAPFKVPALVTVSREALHSARFKKARG
ncbi:class I adenylate-forming enzyme family protein [Plantactinospora sp. CA-294935]|uniref:class I adenylate-forming enzyme family protein n=1 Tax=Plantactinospora sp. CA-294935 TaxID=3240012 RepID=UPI003D90104C